MPQRIDVFDAICGALILHLYESFPVRLTVDFTDLPLDDELKDLSAIEIEQWMDIFFETAPWLEKEGFIRFQTGTDDGDFFGIQLTMSGLAVLRAVPASVDGSKQTLIEKIKGAFGEGGKIASAEGLKVAVGSLASMSSSIGQLPVAGS